MDRLKRRRKLQRTQRAKTYFNPKVGEEDYPIVEFEFKTLKHVIPTAQELKDAKRLARRNRKRRANLRKKAARQNASQLRWAIKCAPY